MMIILGVIKQMVVLNTTYQRIPISILKVSRNATTVQTDNTDLSFEYTHRNNIPLQIFDSYRI